MDILLELFTKENSDFLDTTSLSKTEQVIGHSK